MFVKTILARLETPLPNSHIHDVLTVQGWAFSKKTSLQQVEVFLNHESFGLLPHNQSRPDVASHHHHPHALQSGFSGHINLPPLLFGDCQLEVYVTDQLGNHLSLKALLHIFPPLIRLHLDHASITAHTLQLNGWAFSRLYDVERIEVYLNEHLLGTMSYGLIRPDVSAAFFHPRALLSGFAGNLPLPDLPTGQYDLIVKVTNTHQDSQLIYHPIQLV